MGVVEGIDARNLAQAGWGIVFPANMSTGSVADIKQALNPLLEMRRAQASAANPDYYQEFSGRRGVQNGETKSDWLKRFGRGPGPADPQKMPYYLLLIGSPSWIPYTFQYQLDVKYAVGRLSFETLEEYANYAQNVVAAENNAANPVPSAVFFAPQHADDQLTAMLAQNLIQPIAGQMAKKSETLKVDLISGREANKRQLRKLLNEAQSDPPLDLLFTAGHGIAFPNGHEFQDATQGALLCSDWPGSKVWNLEILDNFYCSANDIFAGENSGSTLVFSLASFSAGTSSLEAIDTELKINNAPHSFVARLPQALLGRKNGRSLAFIGCVDHAWGFSAQWPKISAVAEVYRRVLDDLLAGAPVGLAMENFNEQYGEFSTLLSEKIDEISFQKLPDEVELAYLWTHNRDARSLSIIGDPAVRIKVAPRLSTF